MAFVAIVSLLAGYALGLHCRVLVLAPVTAAVLAVVATTAMISGDSFLIAFATALVGAFSLQFGYLGALVFSIDTASDAQRTAVPSAADT